MHICTHIVHMLLLGLVSRGGTSTSLAFLIEQTAREVRKEAREAWRRQRRDASLPFLPSFRFRCALEILARCFPVSLPSSFSFSLFAPLLILLLFRSE